LGPPLDDPEPLVTLEGGIDDPDGIDGARPRAPSRVRRAMGLDGDGEQNTG
jgi:hypothetical protein